MNSKNGKIFIGDDEVDLPIGGSAIQDLAHQLDTVSLVVRAHLIVEQLIDRYIYVASGIDLLDGCRLGFASKISIAQNLGLNRDLSSFISKFNSIRNSYAHRYAHNITDEEVESLRALCNRAIPSETLEVKDSTFMNLGLILKVGGNEYDIPVETFYKDADLRQKILMILLMFIGSKLIPFINGAEVFSKNFNFTGSMSDYLAGLSNLKWT